MSLSSRSSFFSLSFTTVLRQDTDCTSSHMWTACRADGEMHNTRPLIHSSVATPPPAAVKCCRARERCVPSWGENISRCIYIIASPLLYLPLFVCCCCFFSTCIRKSPQIVQNAEGLKGPLISFLSTGLTKNIENQAPVSLCRALHGQTPAYVTDLSPSRL